MGNGPWTESYRSKVTSAAGAVAAVRSGSRVYIHPGAAEPEGLVRALIERAGDLRGVEIIHLMTLGNAGYVGPGMEPHFRHNAMFVGSNVREAVNSGRADYTPVCLSEIPSLFTSGALPIDVCLIQVSPPDEHGFCSFGVGVDCTKAAVEQAREVIAEVNTEMPRTLGDSFIHVRKLHRVVESSRPVLELPRVAITDLHRRIARNVAALVEDGSTLQMGIGGVPDAVLSYLTDRKDLGVHTEMFSDLLVPLIQAGVVTNRLKKVHPGRTVTSFVNGTRALFDFVHDNQLVEFHPCDRTNDTALIRKNPRVVAINAALEIDLTGQVCADSIGHRIYSGIGGQMDFIRGAVLSEGGKAIIALPSTAKNGQLSRIVSTLKPGAGVVTTRGHVQYVATEYGIVDLHGLNLKQRAEALISIAHPDFRAELAREVREIRHFDMG
jgi:acetyl-CoA hydrolase